MNDLSFCAKWEAGLLLKIAKKLRVNDNIVSGLLNESGGNLKQSRQMRLSGLSQCWQTCGTQAKANCVLSLKALKGFPLLP